MPTKKESSSSKSKKKPKAKKASKKKAKTKQKKAKSKTKSAKQKTTKKSKVKTSSKRKPKAKPKKTAKKTTAAKSAPSKAKSTKALSYEELLQRAREPVPREVFEHPRFTVPKVKTFVQGARTVVRNFKDIADTLRRDTKHILRFLSHELATAGEISGRRAIFNGRFDRKTIEDLVERYTQGYVLCPVCNRPDTEIRREGPLTELVCSACGARTPLKEI